MISKIFIALGMLTVAVNAWASDLAREERIRDQIVDAIFVGEPIDLKAGDLTFLGIHAESNADQTRGAVLILHGMGANPDWPDVIQPLRTRLPDHGWETLSLQMPIAASDAPRSEYIPLIPEAGPRIKAGIDLLKQRGISKIIIAGHSLGVPMGLRYLAETGTGDVSAFVAVGYFVRNEKDPLTGGEKAIVPLTKVLIPILDIYGSSDFDEVRNTADKRKAAARKSGNEDYRQTEVPGANHFFQGQEDTLVSEVRAWLAKVTAGE